MKKSTTQTMSLSSSGDAKFTHVINVFELTLERDDQIEAKSAPKRAFGRFTKYLPHLLAGALMLGTGAMMFNQTSGRRRMPTTAKEMEVLPKSAISPPVTKGVADFDDKTIRIHNFVTKDMCATKDFEDYKELTTQIPEMWKDLLQMFNDTFKQERFQAMMLTGDSLRVSLGKRIFYEWVINNTNRELRMRGVTPEDVNELFEKQELKGYKVEEDKRSSFMIFDQFQLLALAAIRRELLKMTETERHFYILMLQMETAPHILQRLHVVAGAMEKLRVERGLEYQIYWK